jgi:hypothetical protein
MVDLESSGSLLEEKVSGQASRLLTGSALQVIVNTLLYNPAGLTEKNGPRMDERDVKNAYSI